MGLSGFLDGIDPVDLHDRFLDRITRDEGDAEGAGEIGGQSGLPGARRARDDDQQGEGGSHSGEPDWLA